VHAVLALAFLAVLCAPVPVFAQHHGGGGPGGPGGPGGFPGGGMGGGMAGPGMGVGGFPRSGNVGDMSRNSSVRLHGGLQLGPPGRWWDDKHFAKQIKLTQDQQHRMDSIFEQSRPVLLQRLSSLQQEELHMEALTHAKTLDESALFSQIDRIAQARADLEKANTHLLVQLHNELEPDQIARIEAQP
jgi:Spy/CpxP family protein refolding chaperone